MPTKPRIKLNVKLFKTVVQEKLQQTFNDESKKRYRSMLAVIDNLSDSEAPLNYMFGTNRFEYVWEMLIDRVYGIANKIEYFPKTQWNLNNGCYRNSALEPDTIMLWNGNIYVLDAKYYKYGATRKPWDLPESTSINKQITYGEYIAKHKCMEKADKSCLVYNAFLMPFDADGEEVIQHIGEAVSDWKDNNKLYERIQGILVDVKYLMKIACRQESTEIMQLARCIENAVTERIE